VGPPFRGA